MPRSQEVLHRWKGKPPTTVTLLCKAPPPGVLRPRPRKDGHSESGGDAKAVPANQADGRALQPSPDTHPQLQHRRVAPVRPHARTHPFPTCLPARRSRAPQQRSQGLDLERAPEGFGRASRRAFPPGSGGNPPPRQNVPIDRTPAVYSFASSEPSFEHCYGGGGGKVLKNRILPRASSARSRFVKHRPRRNSQRPLPKTISKARPRVPSHGETGLGAQAGKCGKKPNGTGDISPPHVTGAGSLYCTG